MSVFFQRTWKDSRLDFQDIAPDVEDVQCMFLDDIWTPDIYFVHERNGMLHTITTPNHNTRITQKGTVYISSK